MLDDFQFRADVIKRHREHFAHCFNLLLFAQTSLQNYRCLTTSHYDVVLSYIWPRAFKSFDAVRRLCEVAACEDAAVVQRCLMNLMAVTRWISIDPGKRASKYLGWYWVELHERAEQYPAKFDAMGTANIRRMFDQEKMQFEFINKKGKPDFARHWYQPEVRSIYDMFVEVGLRDVYEKDYRDLSATEHSDVMAYYAMFTNAEVGNGEFGLPLQSESNVRKLLRSSFQYFADILGLCNRTIPIADAKNLYEVVAAGMTFYASEAKPEG